VESNTKQNIGEPRRSEPLMLSELTDVERKRRMDRFKRQLRLDLLAGRANRWEVSSPREELEKFRFYFRTPEAFVDQAEGSEVETLSQPIKHLPKDAQDEFWMWHYPIHWRDIFRPIHRSSVVVSLTTFVETILMRRCYYVGVIMEGDSPSLGQDTVKVARKFLSDKGGFQKPSDSEWNEVRVVFQIRNELVHSQELGTVSKRKKAIENFCKNRSDVRLHNGEIEIEPEFLEYIINQLINFIEKLESKFKMLCERTKALEQV
jgi:hypothetical protein